MHISEGVLSGPVLLSGAALAVAGTAIGLRKIDYDRIPQTAMLASVFFVASLVHVPVGASSVHLILNGLVGLMLGWAAFPAILTALLLQTVFFQFGGITVLGVNTCIMALPAVICHYFFVPIMRKKPAFAFPAAFACGALSIFLTGIIAGGVLWLTEENFLEVAALLAISHLPVMIIEGAIIGFVITFLKKVQPDMLPGYSAQEAGAETFALGKARERKAYP